MSQKVLVQVRFDEDTVLGKFQDALYFTESEFSRVRKFHSLKIISI